MFGREGRERRWRDIKRGAGEGNQYDEKGRREREREKDNRRK